MANLQEEYIDTKAIHHRVEHIQWEDVTKAQREQLLEELTYALTKAKTPA